MRILDLFKPAPAAPLLENTGQIKTDYRYWRLRIFYSMYAGYALYYFTRKSVTFAMPALMSSLGFTKTELGILGTVLAIAYGFSKFLSGVMGDRSNPRYFMGVGLILTGFMNILFGFSSSLSMFVVFWGLNGWFQGWGWPPCAKLLTHWYSQSERGRWWGLWNTSHNVGGALIPIVGAACAEQWGWRSAMWLPGVVCIFGGLFLINRLRDTPASMGLPSIEQFRGEPDASLFSDVSAPSTKSILLSYILKNRYLWILGATYFFVYIIRTAVNDWSVLFLVEHRDYTLLGAGVCIFWFETGGLLGSLAAGWLSDRMFQGRRGPVNLLFCLGVTVAVGLFWLVPHGAPFLDSLLMFWIGFLIFGPQMLIGVAAAELTPKSAAGSATGFIGWLGYLGSAAAGLPIGLATQWYGWSGYYLILVGCGLASALLLAPLWKTRSSPILSPETPS
jgi:OPA family sugar phosphate sensor protein UhpC-like MFS transporter